MSKPVRIEFPGAWYHVSSRGLRHVTPFRSTSDYEAFLQNLCEASDRYRIEVHAFCLLPREYHLLVRTPEANLNRAMRHINGVYTQDYQYKYRFEGPVFRGRYRALVLEPDEYLLPVSRVIHRLPVDREAQQVTDSVEWRWSSAAFYCGVSDPPSWLAVDSIVEALRLHDDGATYHSYLAEGVDDELDAFYRRQRMPAVLGSEAFREAVLTHANAGPEAPRQATPSFWSLEEVLGAVQTATGASRPELVERAPRGGSPNTARPIAMWLAQERAGLTLKEIGEAFGGVHYSAVAQAIRRLKQRAEHEATLAEQMRRARQPGTSPSRLEAAPKPESVSQPTAGEGEPTPDLDAPGPVRPSAVSSQRDAQQSLPRPTQRANPRPATLAGHAGQPARDRADARSRDHQAPASETQQADRDALLAYLDSLGDPLPEAGADALNDLESTLNAPRADASIPAVDPGNGANHTQQPTDRPSRSQPVPTERRASEQAAHESVETMIELARSYIDLGDIESAVELINEIIQEGTVEQRNRARALYRSP